MGAGGARVPVRRQAAASIFFERPLKVASEECTLLKDCSGAVFLRVL